MGGSGLMIEWRNFITAKVCGIENRLHDLQSNQVGHYGKIVKQLKKIERNVARLSAMPARRVGAASATSRGQVELMRRKL